MENKEEYNSIPVYYCKKCLSLRVLALTESTDYCDECGCTDIGTTDIETWKSLYLKKYNKPFSK